MMSYKWFLGDRARRRQKGKKALWHRISFEQGHLWCKYGHKLHWTYRLMKWK
uniref:Uncharacterized protein n=2 Tax=Picea TaxID=3328 RepID=A0A117NGD6_PICGL|nr:hypothetical protein ABT39_MTgene1305 [Picea glauca]QHR89799.1 hypothetical protein Q903MT_gene3821 [Picea sitchensis]